MNYQWEIYKALELLPDTVPPPPRHGIACLTWLNHYRRAKLNLLAEKRSFEQQVGYLERSLTLDYAHQNTFTGLWEKLWDVLNRPLVWGLSPACEEPQISQITDREGHLWWQAYDPITGQTTYLDSEQEVQIWLEERLYH